MRFREIESMILENGWYRRLNPDTVKSIMSGALSPIAQFI